jgi:histidinol-phosphate aminotransferase
MSSQYQREPELGEGLRLHLNENTGGCSPKVIEALRALSPLDAAIYPDYDRVNAVCARYLGVDPARLLLTNGLDEGILAAAIAYLRRDSAYSIGTATGTVIGTASGTVIGTPIGTAIGTPIGTPIGTAIGTPLGTGGGGAPEGLRAEPCFGMYADCIEAVGGRIVRVAPPDDLQFPLDGVLAAITPRTRVIYLTSPGNPTGLLIPHAAVHTLARALPEGLVFVDEAYADFTDTHFLGELPAAPNVVVGRTFAKAYGLAALRIGAVVGDEAVIARLQRSLPPYSINVAAAVALEAALGDQPHLNAYRELVRASKARVYAACDRLGLAYWPSEANFVLIRVGDRATAIVEALRERRIFVRDRSNEPGCAGCIRITAGVIAHTEQALAALEEILCAVA